MHQSIFAIAAVALAALAPAYAQKLGDPSDAAAKKIDAALAKVSGRQIVTGKPFSANEERHSLQVLADGTRIESRQTTRIYRDNDGRTRVEKMNGMVALLDPRIGISVALDPAAKLILNEHSCAPRRPARCGSEEGRAPEQAAGGRKP